MTIDETKQIVSKIKSFRPFFQTGFSKSQEIDFVRNWSKVFGPYDYQEVDRNLDVWFSEKGHFGKTPEPYELISGLLTIEHKIVMKDKNAIKIRCPICFRKLGLVEFDNHFTRCSSIEFIVRTRQKYFGKVTDKNKLWQITDEKFDELYLQFCNQLLLTQINNDERKSLKKVLESREVISGKEADAKRKSDGVS